MISLSALVSLVVYLVVVGLVFWLLLYLVDNVGLPEPFHKVARTILLVAGVLVIIYALLSLVGGAPPLFRA